MITEPEKTRGLISQYEDLFDYKCVVHTSVWERRRAVLAGVTVQGESLDRANEAWIRRHLELVIDPVVSCRGFGLIKYKLWDAL